MVALAVEPTSVIFSRSDEATLHSKLSRSDLTSDIIDITSVRDVEMSGSGTIGATNLKPTTWCLYQICKAVCPGLYQALLELTSEDSEDARLAAVSMLNQVIRLRFLDRLYGHRFLCNRDEGTIEAMVGTGYKFLSNLDFYEACKNAMQSVHAETRFFEAVLHGRWLMLKYYSVVPLVKTEWDNMNYHAGWHFSSHEGGRASLRATNMIVRGAGLFSMLLPFTKSGPISHRHKHISNLLQSMLMHVAGYTWHGSYVHGCLQQVMTRKLGFGLEKEEDELARRKRLVNKLTFSGGVSQSLAARVTANMMLQRYVDKNVRPSYNISREDLAERTVMDLVIAASREAKGRDIASRELLEQLAYKLLVGRIKSLE